MWVILLPITLLPVFFAMGWFAARIDMKTVLKQAKSVPAGFYKSLDALVDRNSGRAARELAEVIDQQPQSYDLNLTLGKLYRQRGENDKAINMHQALLNSPDTVNEKRARVLFELAQNYQSAGLVDRAEQIFIGLQEGNMAREARQHLLSIYQQDRDWEKAIETAQLLSHDEQTLLLKGESEAAQLAVELVRQKPDLNGVYRLLGLKISDMNPAWKADADMMRSVIGRQLQRSVMYRCRNCHFKSQVFFWHCPACNKWETFTPNKIEV